MTAELHAINHCPPDEGCFVQAVRCDLFTSPEQENCQLFGTARQDPELWPLYEGTLSDGIYTGFTVQSGGDPLDWWSNWPMSEYSPEALFVIGGVRTLGPLPIDIVKPVPDVGLLGLLVLLPVVAWLGRRG